MFRSEGNFFFVSIDAAAHCEEVPISFQHTKQKNNYEHGLPRHTHTYVRVFLQKTSSFFCLRAATRCFAKELSLCFLRCREVLGT